MTSTLTIRGVRVRAVVAPLRQPVTTASGALNDAPLLLIDVATEQGVTGRAYLLSYQRLALKPLAGLVEALGETIVGAAVVPAAIEAGLRARFTLFGGARGLAGLAVSGLDTALWDALAQAADVSLAVLLGSRPRPIRAYDSLGMVAAAGAAAQAERSRAAGFTALKIKVGWPTLAEDLAAVRAFRRALPDEFALMVDFNQSLSVAEALRRARALDGEGLAWIEEPVRCDDYAGCARVAAAVATPIQIGENFMSVHEMETALAAGACDYVMPDVQQIGGVSGWMRAAALAHARGLECSNHLFIEVSAHLLAAAPTCHYLEYLDVASAVLADPPRLAGGALCAADRPGSGVAWDEAAVTRYALA